MEFIFKSILAGYFILFVTVGILYRSYIIYKRTAVNALTQTPADPTLKVIAFFLKVHLLLVLGLVIDFFGDFEYLTANRFEFINSEITGFIGSALLLFCLPLLIYFQNQMKNSWRIEVDYRTQGELITEGIYQYSRNPIFLILRVTYLAMFLIIPCPFSLFLLILGDVCFQLQVRKEEEYLNLLYGKKYEVYSIRVPRWL